MYEIGQLGVDVWSVISLILSGPASIDVMGRTAGARPPVTGAADILRMNQRKPATYTVERREDANGFLANTQLALVMFHDVDDSTLIWLASITRHPQRSVGRLA